MPYDPEEHHRRSVRLPTYDYAGAAAYFVTVCTAERQCFLGRIEDASVVLSRAGAIVQSVWTGVADRFPNAILDAFVVMPNHVHAIIGLVRPTEEVLRVAREDAMNRAPTAQARCATREGVMNHAPTTRTPGVGAQFIAPARGQAPTLGQIVRSLKAASTRIVRAKAAPDFAWQPNYYERVVRNDRELDRMRAYVVENPARWALDRENPAAEQRDEALEWDC